MSDQQIRRALVTGASRGLGAEFARQLAARGADLVLVARSEDDLRALAQELDRDHAVRCEVMPADLVDAETRGGVEQRLRDEAAPVDLLVNNAGFGAYGRFHELDRDRQTAMIELNVSTVVRLSHAVLPVLRTLGRGGVINISSTAAFQPGPYGATYAATKVFVLSFTEALHEEIAPDGVRAMALCPGFTETGFQDAADVRAGGVPGVPPMTPGPVVETGLRDFARGRAVSVPGAGNLIGALGASVAPSAVTRKLSGYVHRRFAGMR